jgi:hypothetical protein
LSANPTGHTRAGDAIAAARRRLPMVEVDSSLPLTGPHGPVTLLDAFEGRGQLIAYFHMWYAGRPAAEQCEGCTFFNGQVRELSFLHSREVTYAVLCQGPFEESVRYRDFMGWDMLWYSVQDSAEALLAGRGPVNKFYLVCYLRDGDRVFETYWTNGPPAGHEGHRSPASSMRSAPTDARSPSGPAWKPDDPTISTSPGAESTRAIRACRTSCSAPLGAWDRPALRPRRRIRRGGSTRRRER